MSEKFTADRSPVLLMMLIALTQVYPNKKPPQKEVAFY
jgi:hypothetical protein